MNDHENLNAWLEAQNQWMKEADRKRKRRDWIQVGVIWAAVVVVGYLVMFKAEACYEPVETTDIEIEGRAL